MDKKNWYQHSVEKVLEYLDNNIDSDLTLAVLSHEAGFSPFHFHRIFHSYTGKSLHQYILERRLTLAANQLLYKSCDITEIALRHGFSTPSAFSRSFKELFHCTPTKYRLDQHREYPASFANITFPNYSYDEEIHMCFSPVNLTDLQTLCLGVTGLSESFLNPKIEQAFHTIFSWLKSHGASPTTKICGITVDSPEVTSLADCKYYACTTVDTQISSETLAYRTFHTAGSYICCKMKREQPDFAEQFFYRMKYFYGYYLEQYQLVPDYRPFVEFYERDEQGNLMILFCVPVKNSKK
jgi:AraC family transcriptional regulator